ncbi:hypothetical protein OHB33_22205 [Streptomyces sp. NBC_01558]|uniref:hypothetical protein n=1 Tax=Streptomyces sp. NBC_01558 TaxID=2975878 RepID=UPI002DDA1592|nr:hypothetical protein [Streptomyces sp. NBC_01558]WSD78813.1 hypothetical protein OHB33_22205 [Streptomyces sp. NBC_01558]
MNKASRTTLNSPQGAVQGLARPTVGDPKDAARKGVLSAVGSDTQTVTVTGIQPGLRIWCEQVAVADWRCACGSHERARGRAAVIALAARVIVGVCPHATASEGRAAS